MLPDDDYIRKIFHRIESLEQNEIIRSLHFGSKELFFTEQYSVGFNLDQRKILSDLYSRSPK